MADVPTWTIVEITPDVVVSAHRLLLRYPLGSGDAMQLGAALVLEQGLGAQLEEFVAYDVRLVEAARSEQLVVRSGRRR